MGKLLASPARLLGTLLCMTIAGFAATTGWDLYQSFGVSRTTSSADLYVYDPEGVAAEDFADLPESTVYLCSITQYGQDHREDAYYSYVFTEPVMMYGFADAAGARAAGFDTQSTPGVDTCAIGQTFGERCNFAVGDTISLTDADGEALDLTVTEVFPDDGSSAVMVTIPEVSQRMGGTDGFTTAFVDVADDAQTQAFLDRAEEVHPGADAAFLNQTAAPPRLVYLAAGAIALVFSLLAGLLSWELLELIGAPAGALAGAMLWQAVRPAVLWQLFWFGLADGSRIDTLPEGVPLTACLVTAGVSMAAGCLWQLLFHKKLRTDTGKHWGSLALAAGVVIVMAGGSLGVASVLEAQCCDPLRADVIVQSLQGTTQEYEFLHDLPEVGALEYSFESFDTVETEDAVYCAWLYPSDTETLDMDELSLDKELARAMHLKPGDKLTLNFRADSAFPIERRMTVTAYTETPGARKGGGIAVCPMLYRELYGSYPNRLCLNAASDQNALADLLETTMRSGEQVRRSDVILHERHAAQRAHILAVFLVLVYIGGCIVINILHPKQHKEDKL